MRRQAFHFDLPPGLIAQHPAPDRDGARLLVVDPGNGSLRHRTIRDLPDLVPAGTLCVPNDVKVRHARLLLRRPGGGAGEALLLRALPEGFEALVRPGARLKPGKWANVVDPATGQVLAELRVEEALDEGLRRVKVLGPKGELDWDAVDRIGRMPLPPYIAHPAGAEDEARYQTVFRAEQGEAVAAPTAGLHFTERLIAELVEGRGCLWRPVRLHVGLGTFRPMTADDLADHVMHEERFEIPEATAAALEPVLARRTRPLLAVGTTSLRTLEAAWDGKALRRAGTTRLFIQPGYRLRTANHLLTNFHLPESTLFVLVSALLGLDLAQAAYAEAIREQYRFFSYGDAMLILNAYR